MIKKTNRTIKVYKHLYISKGVQNKATNRNNHVVPWYNNVVTVTIVGGLLAFCSSLSTLVIQQTFESRIRNEQFYRSEKKDFIEASNEYLKQYREWHELMNFFIGFDYSGDYNLNFPKYQEKIKEYETWRKNIDYAYGRLLLVSDNDFGPFTLIEVSTVLHKSLSEAILHPQEMATGWTILHKLDIEFFSRWLSRVQIEIFNYNENERKTIPLDVYRKNSIRKLSEKYLLGDSIHNIENIKLVENPWDYYLILSYIEMKQQEINTAVPPKNWRVK